jgi:hypothetical protein
MRVEGGGNSKEMAGSTAYPGASGII